MGQMSTIMIRREVAGELRAGTQLLSDWLLSDWFIGLMASRLGPVGYIDRVMSVFRQHASSGFSSLSRASQWAAFVYGYERVQNVLGEKYHDSIEAGNLRAFVLGRDGVREGARLRECGEVSLPRPQKVNQLGWNPTVRGMA